MKNFPPIRVVAGIITREGRFLAAQRPAGKNRAGFWEFPGGKIEEGEDPPAALRRELREELGIELLRVRPHQIIEHRYPDRFVRLYFFLVQAFAGEPRGREGQATAWVTPAEALELPFLEADLALLKELAKELPCDIDGGTTYPRGC